jgi:hypothetical protein
MTFTGRGYDRARIRLNLALSRQESVDYLRRTTREGETMGIFRLSPFRNRVRRRIIPSFGSITLRTTVLGLGSQNGRATVTVGQTVNQPVTFTGGGFTYKGQFAIAQTQASYVDDGADSQPTTNDTLSFKETFTDKTGTNNGTLSITGTDRTVPSA